MKKSTKADNLEYESSSPFTQVYSFRQQIPSFHKFRSESGDGYSCDFETGMCGLSNKEGNPVKWVRNQGSTPTPNTGPSTDHTKSNNQGYYAFVNAALLGNGGKTTMFTEKFSATSNSCLKFWYYMYGQHCGFLTISVADGKTGTSATIWKRWFDQGDGWILGQANIISKESYTIEFEVYNRIAINAFEGDVALDDIAIVSGSCEEIGDCDFDLDMCSWTNDAGNDFDWSRQKAGDVTVGPRKDHTLSSENVSTQYDCDFELGSLCSWTQSKTDHFDWKAIQAKSNGGHGPVIDQTRRTGNGWYIYIESEDQTVGDKAQLLIFEAECGSSYHGDIALDGILYMNGECRFPEIHDMDCDFEDPFNRLCGWQQEKDDDFDFVVGTGATRIHHEIGPSIDHTTRTENGKI
ncbi:MAM and LDL-receptor class A domain-containing protein 1-like [Ptychodera flava]|uniref:MAM and LDL-receptor class A domain-containing protein 1-like n=1 Tax=Ptychodera flava TaxID=63121 RepID=UPI00396A2E68